MTPSEAAAALGIAASVDNRTVTESAARMWAKILEDIRLEDAAEAIEEHYTKTRDWIMPADIINIVKTIRRRRVQDIQMPAPPETIDPDDVKTEQEWTKAYVAARADNHDHDTADRIACATVNVTRPALEASPRPVAPVIEAFAKDSLKRVPGKAS